MSMTPQEMIQKLKSMGLSPMQRFACMETYRDAGADEAIEQATSYLQRERRALQDSKNAAVMLCGINI